MAAASINLNKLRWRARRGTKELDRILQGFLASEFEHLNGMQQGHFALLLEQADPDIVDWLNGNLAPDHQGLGEIIELVRDYSTQ